VLGASQFCKKREKSAKIKSDRSPSPAHMTPEQQAAIATHLQSIAEILYENTPVEQLETLEGIEIAIREHLQDTVGPELALFLSVAVQEQLKGALENSKVVLES
jgi:hypothetical protein